MSALGVELVLRHIPGSTLPLATPAPAMCWSSWRRRARAPGCAPRSKTVLAAAMEAGIVADAVIAESGAQRAQLWRLREEHSEAQKRAGASVKNDVSVPVSKVPELIRRSTEICERLVPGIRCVPFGHLGDGNIHVNLVQPEGMEAAAFLARDHELMDAVNAVVRDLDGSFSAEHGIGRLKPYMMPEWRGGAELELMRRIKEAIDPQGHPEPGEAVCPELGPPVRLGAAQSRCRLRLGGIACSCSHPVSAQLRRVERLLQRVVGAQQAGDFQHVEPVAADAAGDRHDFRGRALAPDLPDGFDAFLFGHEDVGDYQLRTEPPECLHAAVAVLGGDHFVAAAAQHPRQRVPHPAVVIDHQYLHSAAFLFVAAAKMLVRRRALSSRIGTAQHTWVTVARALSRREFGRRRSPNRYSGIASRVSMRRLSSTTSLRANSQPAGPRTTRSM